MQLISCRFFDAPGHEIDQAIKWLEHMEADFNSRIEECREHKKELLSIKEDRERARKRRSELKRLGAQFNEPEYLEMDKDTLASIIQQRLGGDWSRAYALVDLVRDNAKRNKKKAVYQEIAVLYRTGEFTMEQLGKKYGKSKQSVSKIIKKSRE
jgi:hypothetical protein